MKKFVSVLLIIAMMATTMSVVFAGTVTAFAAESTVAVTTEESSEGGSTGLKMFAGFLWFINEVCKGILHGGVFSVLLDDVFEYIEKNVFDVSSIYTYLENSGIVEWVAHLIFPR